MIVPIFIHVREKSDKELKEEMERDRKWHEAVEAEEARERERKERERIRLQNEKEEKLRKLEKEYDEKRIENPWDYSFLPEGWSIFGTPLKIVKEI